MAGSLSPGYVAYFPASAGDVLVVVSDLQDPKALAATLAQLHRDEPATRIHLLAPQQPPSGYARHHLRRLNVRKVLREAGTREIAKLGALLDAAGVPHQRHVEVGPWLETIAAFARDCGCRRIFLGDNARSLVKNLLLRHDCVLLRTYLSRNGMACRVLCREQPAQKQSARAKAARREPLEIPPDTATPREPCAFCREGASGERGHPGVSAEASAIPASDRTYVHLTCQFCGVVWVRHRLNARMIEWLRIAA